MSGWSLGIDFGTSYTVAASATDSGVQTVDVEGNGRDRLPSAVFLNGDGELLVGTAAQHQAKFAPERFEPTPKRSLGEGELFLGDRLVPVSELVSAVLARAFREACQHEGERLPDVVRVTHPADWGDTRKAVLLEACAKAQIPNPQLVPEPVAAAVRIALQVTPPERHIAVYDFGGGTFDAAVLLRTEAGFEVAGPPVGRDPLGGEDIDQRIIDHLGELLAEDHPDEWSRLLAPQDVDWRGAAAELRAEVQQAKETLSDSTSCQLWVPGIKRGVQLTRHELEELIADDINATVDALEAALADAGVTANDLAGLYLVGGSSRIPLVEHTLWNRIGVKVSVQDNPKSVVASGAAGWTRTAKRRVDRAGETAAARGGAAAADGGAGGVAAAPPTSAGPDPPRVHAPNGASGAGASSAPPITQEAPTAELPAGERFQPRLAVRLDRAAGTGSDRAVVQLLTRSERDGTTVQVRDSPAKGDTAAVAAAALVSWRKRTRGFRELSTVSAQVAGVPGGVERRFALTARDNSQTSMVERYLVIDGRALVITGPADAAPIISSVVLREAPPADGSAFHARLDLPSPPGWLPAERLSIWPPGAPKPLIAEHEVLSPTAGIDAWVEEQVAVVMKESGATLVSRSPVQLFRELEGELITVTWRDGRKPMVTRLGAASDDTGAFTLRITAPLKEPRLFSLADRFFLRAAIPSPAA